jgi:hypothetical protein
MTSPVKDAPPKQLPPTEPLIDKISLATEGCEWHRRGKSWHGWGKGISGRMGTSAQQRVSQQNSAHRNRQQSGIEQEPC